MNHEATALREGLTARLAAIRPGLDLLGLPACVVDAALRYRIVNAAYAAHFDRQATEFLNRTYEEVFRSRLPDDRRQMIERALGGETVASHRRTAEGPRAGGWVRAHYFPLREDAGEVVGVVIVLIDFHDDRELRQALVDRSKQLQLVTDSIGVPMSYLDRNRRFRFANHPGTDWPIAIPEEAIGKRIEEVYDAATLAIINPEIDKAFAGESRIYDRLAPTKDGGEHWVRVHLVPDIDSQGKVQGLYTMLHDVEADYRLREAREHPAAQLRYFAYFAENIPGPIAVVDAQFRYVFANQVYQRSLGKDLGALVGQKGAEVMGGRGAPYFAPYGERLKRSETCSYELRDGPPGGEQRWLLVSLAPIMDGEGSFNGYYIVGSDIHEIKLGEERLRAQEAHLRLFTDNIPDAVAYLDRDRRFQFANRPFAEQRGLHPDEVIGKTTADLLGHEV